MIENRTDYLDKDNLTVEGVTEDYVWYNSKLLIQEMQTWQHKFEKMVKVMEDRHNEHLKMIDKLLSENHVLRMKEK
jgi:hypothetical protein